ncbi:hypothetical protein GCM10027169_17040 [Gordonia jinhuaensis]|uniref:Uncharacterized protein n=1 Tax=Gordonia jinhuaensis TaxID=1517702 RepID=A0A916TJK4_9ACTN|nr:hypothetical protein [Gordonia jinhuaensis]GGB47633.1 hypothetical protein GCM10011489_38570 [Gordonia jinhuaensis]
MKASSGAARLGKTNYTVVDRGVRTWAQDYAGQLGCAYAIPARMEIEAAQHYSPWTRATVEPRFRIDNIHGVDLAVLEPMISWRISRCRRYICNTYFDTAPLRQRTWTRTAFTVTICYDQPVLSASRSTIGFTGTISLDLMPGENTVGFHGIVCSDGTGDFDIGIPT